jgi:phosphatidylglycerol:prolipoprotein diacylglycerol transferase
MAGPYTHRIDPVVADFGGVYVWWYGLGFAIGLVQIHRFLVRTRLELGLSLREVWTLSLSVAFGVLICGRLVEIAFDEWFFYRRHPQLIPAYWLGGMATHGLMLGAAVATWIFSRLYGRRFLPLADALVIPGALLMGIGRIGNFIDGQIVGGVTDVWWAVKFPDAEGFRHPVVLYDAAKNLLLACFLRHVRRTCRTPGATAARFVFWYAFPRIVIDLFRDYPTHRLALGTGQTLNIVMASVGIVTLIRSRLRRLGRLGRGRAPAPASPPAHAAPLMAQRVAFACVLTLCVTIPSNWTQNVPARYGARHEGMRHSSVYPNIDTTPARH